MSSSSTTPIRTHRTTTALWLLLAFASAASALTVQEIVQLKAVGFTDAQIQKAVRDAGDTFNLTDADVAALRQAGCGDALIDFLRSTGRPKKLSVEDVIKLAEAGKTAEQILKQIEQTESTFQLTPQQVLQLTAKRVPLGVVIAMRKAPLTVANLKELAKTPLTKAGYKKLAAMVGFGPNRPGAADALALMQAGVPAEIVRSFVGGAAPSPTPAEPLPPTPPLAGDMAEFEHVFKLFKLRHPKSWHRGCEIMGTQIQHFFTSQPDVKKMDEMTVGVAVSVLPIERGAIAAGMDAVTFLKHMMPTVAYEEPQMKPMGTVEAATLGGLPAGRLVMKGTSKDRPGECYAELLIAKQDSHAYLAMAICPLQQQAAMAPLFKRIFQESRFGRPRAAKPTREILPREISRRYKESVVSIETGGATGTGFIITKDGYVLTNCHVIFKGKMERRGQRIYAEWDDSLNRPKRPCTLVGAVDRDHKEVFLGGIDVALLKLPPGEYKPIPLTRLRDVELGDGAVALGFPQRGVVTGLSLFLTKGVVIRFNRRPNGQVSSVFTGAKVASGNSGGPCINLATGGVMGLNTWRQPISTAGPGVDLNDLVGYYAVCPTDAACAEFPLAAVLRRDASGADLSYEEAYELSVLLADKGTGEAAERLAGRAVALRPNSADALCRLGSTRLRVGLETADKDRIKAAEAALSDALRHDGNHETALLTLAGLEHARGNLAAAVGHADKAVAAHPQSWTAFFARARLHAVAKRYADALSDLEEVKKHSAGVLPEPFMLAGELHYARGNFDAGKAEYAKASALQPSNLEAAVQARRFWELRKEYDKAITEYTAILEQFAGHPMIHTRIGVCHARQQQYDKAIDRFITALEGTRKHESPPFDANLYLGRIQLEVRKNARVCAFYWSRFLLHYGQRREAAEVHMKLGATFLNPDPERNNEGITFAHLRCAKLVLPDDPKVDEALNKARPAGMREHYIVHLLKTLKYPDPVVAHMCRNTPMAFKLDKDCIRRLVDNGVPLNVVVAIDTSVKRYPILPPKDQVDRGHDLKLVGFWVAPMLNAHGQKVGDNILEFRGKQGNWLCINTVQGDQIETRKVSLTWRTKDAKLFVKNQQGQEHAYAYKADGNRLTVSYPPQLGGDVVYRKARVEQD